MTQYAVCASDVRFASSCFTGKERDSESGNDYFGARYYGSSMGRFMYPNWSAKATPVPYAKLDDPQSLNLYAYVRNNPLAMIDKDGHFFHWCSESGNQFCDDGERGSPPEDWNPAPKQYFKTLDEAQKAGANASFQAMVKNGRVAHP